MTGIFAVAFPDLQSASRILSRTWLQQGDKHVIKTIKTV
jgi:hypothetical protein